jgi:hypothetical protein
MTTLSESARQGDFLRWELEPNFCREEVMTVAVAALKKGQVLAILTSDGKYYPSVDGVSSGLENPVGILLEDMAITTGRTAVVLLRFAILVPGDMIWGASYDSAGKIAAGVAKLKSASNILVVPAAKYV